jgi:hypothetical protein
MKTLLKFAMLLFAAQMWADSPVIGTGVTYVFTDPTGGACVNSPPILVYNGQTFVCKNAAYVSTGGTAGSGTVENGTATNVSYYVASGTAVSGAPNFRTNGSHQSMGATGTIDGVPTIFWGSASAILNAQETSTTATGSNGIYVDETWAPASTVTPGGTGIFGIGSNVTVNLDGQATGDTYSAAADFTLSDESNTTGAAQEYAEYVNFNKTGTSTDGEISVLDIEGTMTAGTESDHITNTLSHFSFSGGNATGSGAGNALYDATLTVSGGTPGTWNFYRVNGGDTQLTGGTIPSLNLFDGGAAFGNGATITDIVDFKAEPTSGGANVTGLYIGQMTGTTTSLQIDSEGTAPSLFKGPMQATIYQETLTTPASSSAACTAGQFTDDANYHYVCVAANTWKRALLTTF